MCPFIETICIEQGRIMRLAYHNERMNRTRRLCLGASESLDLAHFISPEACIERTKCRVVYDTEIREVTYSPYHLRPVATLQLVYSDEADYRYKSADRTVLNELFACRAEADDVLVVRQGLLTDTSICNVALWNGEQWQTPAEPLLAGTHRATLLNEGVIEATSISVSDLSGFSRIRLFNALIGFGEIDLPISCICR